MNTLNSGQLETLKPGQTLLIGARQVGGGKIQLEFAEKISASDKPMNALSLLNKSDSRFSSGARRAWATAEPADASEALDINFGDDGEWYSSERGEEMDLYMLNPETSGLRFRVQIIESVEPTEWEADNIDRAAKRAGKDGDFITHNGNYIFSRAAVVLLADEESPVHSFLKSDTAAIGAKPNLAETADAEMFSEVAS